MTVIRADTDDLTIRNFEWTITLGVRVKIVRNFVFSAVSSGHLAQRLSVKPALSGQGPSVLRPSGGQVGQLFAGFATLASAQLSAWHAAGTFVERAAWRARVHHGVRTERGRRYYRRRDGGVRQTRRSIK